MRHVLKAAALFTGLSTIVTPAAAEDKPVKGVHVPHTKIWVETAKVSDRFSPSSVWVEAFHDDECVFVTRTEQKTLRERDNLKVGDCLLYMDGFIVSDIEWLALRMTAKSNEAAPSNGMLKVAREGEEWEYPAYLMTEEEK